ncbi:MAG: ubiquinol-cytochrome c reductase iron-sulfur subunit [Vicinamibacterales bacterium]
MEPDQPSQPGRRSVLVRLGTAAGAAALAAQGGIVVRSLVANVSYDAPSRMKLGLPEAFPDGLTLVPHVRLFVSRRGKRFRVLSAVCTHLGCTVRAEASLRPDPTDPDTRKATQVFEFACPCHGSRYQTDGSNLSGPAPRPLPAYTLTLAPDDGQLVVDLDDEADPGVELTVP